MQPKYQYALYLILCPIVLVSYLLERFTDDVRIYLGVGFITDKMGGVDNAWEIKPPGNRFLFETLSHIPGDGLQYQILLKAIVAIAAILIIWYFAKQVSDKTGADFDVVFILSFLSVFAIADYVLLEVEWFCVLITMLMIGLYLSDHTLLWEIAGILALPLFLMKGISIVFVITAFAIVHLLDNRQFTDDLAFYAGLMWAGIGFVVLQLTIFPHMVPDMILSAQLSHVAQMDLYTRIITFVTMAMTAYWYIPVIAVGIALLLGVYYYDVLKHPRSFLWLLLAWASAAALPFIQGEFFQYQFAGFIIPSVITIIWFMQLDTGWKHVFPAVICLILFMWIFYAAGWGYAMSGYHNTYWDNRESEALALNEKYNLSNQGSILFLDPGDAPYYFRSVSASRYICPMPVQRDSPGWQTNNTQAYNETYRDIMRYNGSYIVGLDWWFFQNMTADKQAIRDKIDAGYTLVHNGSWTVFQKNRQTINTP